MVLNSFMVLLPCHQQSNDEIKQSCENKSEKDGMKYVMRSENVS